MLDRTRVLTPGQAYFSRRQFIRRTHLGVLGLSLSELLALERSADASDVAYGPGSRVSGKARSVLVLLEQGGLSHVDTWDPKPDQVSEHRSPFKPIPTSAPGVQFTELLRKTASVAHHLAVLRGMNHKIGDHPMGTAYALQGNNPNGPIRYPDLGGLVAYLAGSEARDLPPYIMIPGNSEQAYNSTHGFLPAGFAAFKTGGADLSQPGWRVEGLTPTMPLGRIDRRRRLLGEVDAGRDYVLPGTQTEAADAAYERAFNAVISRRAREAFDLGLEPANLREHYGMGHRGHCYLLGRRLIEAGVRFVTVDVRWPKSGVPKDGDNLNWDHHDLIYTNGSCGSVRDKCGGEGRYGIQTWPMMGSVDQAFSALIQDMHDRGLLAETLVCFITEFGRTPVINKCQGRDHWPNAYSIVMAGAGIRGGQVIGATDRVGGEVTEGLHTPEDYAETVLAKLGFVTAVRFIGPGDRPTDFTPTGKAIEALL